MVKSRISSAPSDATKCSPDVASGVGGTSGSQFVQSQRAWTCFNTATILRGRLQGGQSDALRMYESAHTGHQTYNDWKPGPCNFLANNHIPISDTGPIAENLYRDSWKGDSAAWGCHDTATVLSGQLPGAESGQLMEVEGVHVDQHWTRDGWLSGSCNFLSERGIAHDGTIIRAQTEQTQADGKE